MSDDMSRMVYEVDYPNPYKAGVWRLTFMVRYGGKIFAGIQDYDGREPNDLVTIECNGEGNDSRCPQDKLVVTGKRVTESGAALTLRWYADQKGRLYWITLNHEGVVLRVTIDGQEWLTMPLPQEAGRPTDVMRVGDRLVLLAERGVFSTPAAKLVPDANEWMAIATVDGLLKKPKEKSPFTLDDYFCGAPIAAFDGALYVGGQRGGALYRVVEDK